MFFGQLHWQLSEIPLYISDMEKPASGLKAAILDRTEVPGSVWTPSDFLDLGSREAVDKALQRLAKSDELRRIDRGLYDRPAHNELTHQANPPSPKAVIDAVARRDQIRVLVDGMTAANDLGFTNAVPAKIIVHAETGLKTIKLGNMAIIFKPTAASKLFWAGRPAMRIVQALHWLRDTMLGDENDQWRERLVQLLDDPVHGETLRTDLAAGMTSLPVWMQELLRPIVFRQEPGA
jgi:hypothetical protein